jgi:hypothetical protein
MRRRRSGRQQFRRQEEIISRASGEQSEIQDLKLLMIQKTNPDIRLQQLEILED